MAGWKRLGGGGMLLGLGLVLAGPAQAQVPTRQYSLFTDHKSHRLDDLITIIIDEQNTASNRANARSKTSSKTRFNSDKGKGATSFFPSAKERTEAEGSFDGSGQTGRHGDMNATVSARVVGVLGNGNLEVEGTKEVVLNDETEVIKITGIVRPEDIDGQNRVRSGLLANARIAYTGRGASTDAMQKGVLAQVFDWLF